MNETWAMVMIFAAITAAMICLALCGYGRGSGPETHHTYCPPVASSIAARPGQM